MFSLYYFIFQRLIWKAIRIYFLWFHYWIIKEWKAAKVENHSVSAYQLFIQMIVPLLDMLTGAMFIFCSVRFLNMCKPKTGWPTSIWILWKWDGKPAELSGDGECRLTWFHLIRNILTNEIYHFSRLSHQTGCLFIWRLLYIIRMLFCIKCWS